MTSKQQIRKQALLARQSLVASGDDIDHVIALFDRHIVPQPGQVVAGYWPMRGEFDVLPLLSHLQSRDIDIALPIMDQNGGRVLSFCLWDGQSQLIQNKWGVMQPAMAVMAAMDADTPVIIPDILIIPFLAFDRRGYRLGYGGGYYDATIAHLRANLPKNKDLTCLGVGYDGQICLFSLPVEDHDQKLDWVITPQQAYRFN